MSKLILDLKTLKNAETQCSVAIFESVYVEAFRCSRCPLSVVFEDIHQSRQLNEKQVARASLLRLVSFEPPPNSQDYKKSGSHISSSCCWQEASTGERRWRTQQSKNKWFDKTGNQGLNNES